jgi:hypothetical protein
MYDEQANLTSIWEQQANANEREELTARLERSVIDAAIRWRESDKRNFREVYFEDEDRIREAVDALLDHLGQRRPTAAYNNSLYK